MKRLLRRLKWTAALLGLGGAGTGLYLTQAQWLPLVHSLLHR